MSSVIITSTGRTGTYYLYKLLSQYCTDCDVHHNSKYTAIINVISNVYLSRMLPEKALRWIWTVLKYREVYGSIKRIYVDSNNHLFALVAVAPDLYPNLSVIHLIRDPRFYVRSHLNWAYSRKKSYLANFIIPFWQPNAYLTGNMDFLIWYRMSWFERFCWIWNYKNEYISTVSTSRTPYLVIKVEDLFDHERHCYDAISDFTGIKLSPEKKEVNTGDLNQSTSDVIKHWKSWSDRDCAILDTHCGDLMRQYGYGMEVEWKEKVMMGYRVLC